MNKLNIVIVLFFVAIGVVIYLMLTTQYPPPTHFHVDCTLTNTTQWTVLVEPKGHEENHTTSVMTFDCNT